VHEKAQEALAKIDLYLEEIIRDVVTFLDSQNE
jgi:hypothetical protein